jgi:hypothetical protein
LCSFKARAGVGSVGLELLHAQRGARLITGAAGLRFGHPTAAGVAPITLRASGSWRSAHSGARPAPARFEIFLQHHRLVMRLIPGAVNQRDAPCIYQLKQAFDGFGLSSSSCA